MRHLTIAVFLLLSLGAVAPRRAEATEVTIEVRTTPPLVRPDKYPSLCAMLALSLSEHVWAGAELGPGWTGQVTDRPRPATTSGNSEFYAIIWRKSEVRACSGWTGLRYQEDNDGGPNGIGPDNFAREPAYGWYEYGPAGAPAGDFLLAAYHATFHGDAAIKAEVAHLGDVFASMQSARPGEKDLMIVGDFNRLSSQLTTRLPAFADKTQGSGSTLNSSGKITNNLYDHVVVFDSAATKEMQGSAVVLDVRSAESSPSKFYAAVSDHLPIMVVLKSAKDDD